MYNRTYTTHILEFIECLILTQHVQNWAILGIYKLALEMKVFHEDGFSQH